MVRVNSRDKIVCAARRRFYTHGFGSTSLGDLARASGVPKGNFYYHFRSKDDVLRAVIDARRQDITAALKTWAEGKAPAKRLALFIEMISSKREDLLAYGCPLGSLLTELGKQSDLKGYALPILELYVRFSQDAFHELGLEEPQAREWAERLLSRAQGAILIAHAYDDGRILTREIEELKTWIEEIQHGGRTNE